MPLTREELIGAWAGGLRRGAAAGPEEAVPDSPGAFMTALDYVSRPVSGIMGGLFGSLSEDLTVGEGVRQGLTGERYFSAYDFALEGGADPDALSTHLGSLAVDILNPTDPLNYVGAGFTKAGRVAKGLSVLGDGGATTGKVLNRVEAAKKGLWSPIVFAGRPVLPAAASVPVARLVDKAGDRITKSMFVKALKPYLGGVKKFEADAPGLDSFMRGLQHAKGQGEEAFVGKLNEIEGALLKAGHPAEAVRRTMDDVLNLLETPEVRLAELGREKELVVAAREGQLAGYLPEGLDAAEAEAVTKVNFNNQRAVDRRYAELTMARRALLGDAPDFSGSAVPGEVFHGSPRGDLTAIAAEGPMLGTHAGASNGGLGAYFSDDPGVAELIGGTRTQASRAAGFDSPTVYGAEINVKRPLDLDRLGDGERAGLEGVFPGFSDYEARLAGDQNGKYGLLQFMQEASPDARGALKGMGYDGIVVNTIRDVPGAAGPRKQFVVFDTDNIYVTRRRGLDDTAWSRLDEGASAGSATSSATGALKSIDDELHVLKSVQVARFVDDMPPMDVLSSRLEAIGRETAKVAKLWDEAGPAETYAYERLQPLFDYVGEIYDSRLKALDPNYERPVQDYVKHMFPLGYSKLPANVKASREAILAEKQALVLDLAAKGYDERSIERLVREQMGSKHAVLDASDSNGVLRGDLDAFKHRQYNETVAEFNARAGERGLPEFETYSGAVASAMYRDASRWSYAYDVHDFILKKPGWTLGAEDYGKLSQLEQTAWTKMDFHVPWIDQAKNPFDGRYMKNEVAAIRDGQLRGMNKLLTDDGLNGVLGALNTFRKYWVAWTLAPFPATRMRDIMSDVILNNTAGLNPAIDMARAVTGESRYGASLALNARRSKLGGVRSAVGSHTASLDNLMGKVQQKFPELDEKALVEYMEIEQILGPSAVRDLDIGAVLSNDPLLQKARKEQGRARRMLSGVTLNPDRSPVIKAGFKTAETLADFTRGALFFDSMLAHLDEAKSLEDLMTASTAVVRRHLFDYNDLTRFERDVLKNVVPFYTFTAKNFPLQLQKAATEPGHNAWANRLYQGAWDQYEEGEVRNEDLPDWLSNQLGMPIQAVELEDGTKTYAIWTPRGWLPQTELNEMADIFRGDAMTQILSRVSPLLKEPLEQLINKDSFTQREIADGTIRDVMGVAMNPRAAHLISNVRLVTTLDTLDPGGMFTKIGQQLGYWEDERPHRWSPPEGARWTRFLTGINTKGVAPVDQTVREFRDAQREMNSAKSRAQYAGRKGQTLEKAKFLDAAKAQRERAGAAVTRLNELRMRNALALQGKNIE